MKPYFFSLFSRARFWACWRNQSSRGLVVLPTSSCPTLCIKEARILSTKVKCFPFGICSSILLLLLIGMVSFSTRYVDYPYMLKVIVSEIKGEEWTCSDLTLEQQAQVPACATPDAEPTVGTGEEPQA